MFNKPTRHCLTFLLLFGFFSVERSSSEVSIFVGETQDDMDLCRYWPHVGEPGQFSTIPCDTPVSGRYIKLTGGAVGDSCADTHPFVQLCEFQAFGFFPGSHAIIIHQTCCKVSLIKGNGQW